MINIESFYKDFFKPGLVTTDSRNIIDKGVFIALKGDNFNGNTFASEAIKAGARVAVVDEPEYQNNENIFLTENSLEFLQQLARYHRTKTGIKIIALTGTNGKTTTKELIKCVLSQKFKCQATTGNLNNHIGVPLTLLSIQKDTQIAIVEMGANHPGEIAQLCDIALPDYGLITNIGKAHLEGFGSFEGVIKTKSELFNFIKTNHGKFFYNASNPILVGVVNNYPESIKYNTAEHLNARIVSNLPSLSLEVYQSKKSKFLINSNLFGEYNLENILASICIGFEFGLTEEQIIKGVESYIPANNRSQVIKKGSNTLILDCYNANPTSMHEALISFSKISDPRKLAILGGMRELGSYSIEEHRRLIDLLANLKLHEVILLGKEFETVKQESFKYFSEPEALINYLKGVKIENRHILIKGSRGNKLENIVEYL